jgi:hypothetical protein
MLYAYWLEDHKKFGQRVEAIHAGMQHHDDVLCSSCLVPALDGAYFSEREKEALWDRLYTGAPQRQRRSVERYNIVKRA